MSIDTAWFDRKLSAIAAWDEHALSRLPIVPAERKQITARRELSLHSAGERQHCEETNQGRSAVIGAQPISEQIQIDRKESNDIVCWNIYQSAEIFQAWIRPCYARDKYCKAIARPGVILKWIDIGVEHQRGVLRPMHKENSTFSEIDWRIHQRTVPQSISKHSWRDKSKDHRRNAENQS